MKVTRRRYELSDEEWEKIKRYFPERTRHTIRRPRKEVRTTVNGILGITHSGSTLERFAGTIWCILLK